VPKLPINFEESVSRANGNFNEQNMALETSTILTKYRIIIIIIIIIIIDVYYNCNCIINA